MDIVLENIIVGKADTTANWTSDATVYSLGFMMISSDATYSGTNVKKLKIANGVDAWADIDFVPVAVTLAQILLKDNKTGGEPIHSDDEYSVLKVLNNEIALLIDDGATGGANFLGDYTRAKMRFVEYATFKTGEINIDISRTYIKHSDLIELTAPSVKINNDEALAYKWYNDVNANSNGIINLRDAVAPQEPITKSQFDSYNASVGRQRGAIDCSANPNYPASNVGDRWEVTVAGKIGGASGIDVQIYDEIVCKTASVSGDQATVGMNFYVIQGNVERASESVGGYTQYATDAEVQAGTENTKTFTPLKLTNWWSYIKGIANTWALKQTFTTAPRLSSNSASTPLAVDSNKDVSDLTDSIWGAFLNGLTGKTTPVDTDSIGIVDSADSNKSKKLTFTNLKAFLKTYFDTLYAPKYEIKNLKSLSANLASATTYYLGPLVSAWNVTQNARRFNFEEVGTVEKVSFNFGHSGTPTNEQATLYLRNSTTATDYTLGNIDFSLCTTNWSLMLEFTGLSIPVNNSTDHWTLKLALATMGTAPPAFFSDIKIYNRY